ncbi:SCP-like protein [Onchocerca flexuosa]|uniref:SCP-like protein n=1 Tax=Onchocerca flexuosa TaxID=387005 RepID=A0A238BTC4_9BILA|nr:SCP-like protein [Onchocerca flexuosa]
MNSHNAEQSIMHDRNEANMIPDLIINIQIALFTWCTRKLNKAKFKGCYIISLPYSFATLALPCVTQIIYGLYQFNEVQKRQIITIHNHLRAREPASNMQELVWDQRLADLAYGHAMRCDAWHRSGQSAKELFNTYERRGHGYFYIGENIWWSNEAYLRPYLQSVMLDFFNERPYYDYNTNRCMEGAQCGHYTQFVWGETCAVGCAAVHCNGIRNGRGIYQGHIIICNYGEGGNQFGKRPYLYGPRCTRCRCGGPCTSEGLCPSCCIGLRYFQQSFLYPPAPITEQYRKSWQNKVCIQQKQKNYEQKRNNKLYNCECRDLDPYCEYWARTIGCHSNYRDFMIKRCPKTCKICYPLISAKSQVFFSNFRIERRSLHYAIVLIKIQITTYGFDTVNVFALGKRICQRVVSILVVSVLHPSIMNADIRTISSGIWLLVEITEALPADLLNNSSYHRMDYGYSIQIFPKWLESVIQKLSDAIFKYPGLKIIDHQLYEYYKTILRYEVTLQLLKDALEENYKDYHWNDPKFCKAYLELYAAYRELRMMAKRDYRGEVDPSDERWIRFDDIKPLKR